MVVKVKPMVMGKKDMVEGIVKKTKLTKKETEMAINAFLEVIKENLKKKAIRLIPFGTFEVRERSARTGRNPRTGAKIHIKARKVPVFKPGKALREAVK
jgi:DNA-binding protein HU-beta